MLEKNKIAKIAEEYLLKNNFPILGSGKVVFASEATSNEVAKYLSKNNIAEVSFVSKYFYDPHDENPCDPGIYIVYVNLDTGEVNMPRHM